MAKAQMSPDQIADHVSDLEQVLNDWRNHRTPDDTGNPWEWKQKTLEDYIADHRGEW